MKKYLLTLLLAVIGTISVAAQQLETCVIVEFKNGETLALALAEKPKAQFEGTSLQLVSETFEGTYITADIKRFYFDDIEAAIKTITADENSMSRGTIYDINGRKVASYNGTIDSTTLPQGVYVVKTEAGKGFKVTKK